MPSVLDAIGWEAGSIRPV